MQRRSSDKPVIYTIGYGSRSRAGFLRLLHKNKIEVLVDVRRWPNSKNEEFKRASIEGWLQESSIIYVWMGDSLGGFRRGGYEKYMSGAEFQKGVSKLLELAEQNRVCIMCLEVNPKGCHRRHIARYLRGLGVVVKHIISDKKVVDDAELV